MNNIIIGMTVLEQIPIKEHTILSNIFMILGIIIAFASIFFLLIKTKKKEIDFKSDYFKKFLFFYILGLIIAISSIVPFSWSYSETGRYTYECTLEDNVSANYINDNFNIICVEDDIWTIEDKE